jgi:hypothetical protein
MWVRGTVVWRKQQKGAECREWVPVARNLLECQAALAALPLLEGSVPASHMDKGILGHVMGPAPAEW